MVFCLCLMMNTQCLEMISKVDFCWKLPQETNTRMNNGMHRIHIRQATFVFDIYIDLIKNALRLYDKKRKWWRKWNGSLFYSDTKKIIFVQVTDVAQWKEKRMLVHRITMTWMVSFRIVWNSVWMINRFKNINSHDEWMR